MTGKGKACNNTQVSFSNWLVTERYAVKATAWMLRGIAIEAVLVSSLMFTFQPVMYQGELPTFVAFLTMDGI